MGREMPSKFQRTSVPVNFSDSSLHPGRFQGATWGSSLKSFLSNPASHCSSNLALVTWLPGPLPPCSLLQIPSDSGIPVPCAAWEQKPSLLLAWPPSLRPTLAPPWDLGSGWNRGSSPNFCPQRPRETPGRLGASGGSPGCTSARGSDHSLGGRGLRRLGSLTAHIIHPHFSDVLMVPKGCSPAATSDSDLGEARESEGKPIYGPSGMCRHHIRALPEIIHLIVSLGQLSPSKPLPFSGPQFLPL